MEIFAQIALFALGFLTWHLSGSIVLAIVFGVAVAVARALCRLPLLYAPALPILGALSSIHCASGDLMGLAIVSLGLAFHLSSFGRAITQEEKFFHIFLPIFVLLYFGINSAHGAISVLGILCLIFFLPISWANAISRLRPIALAAYVLHMFVSPFSGRGGSVYIEHGKWATISGDYGSLEDGLSLRNETTYSYSWLSKIVADRSGDIMSLGEADGTAWLVTPTKPFSQDEISHLDRWVRRGGRLVIVADHTDYLGHARCLNQLTPLTGITVKFCSFLPPADVAEVTQPFAGAPLLTKTPTSGSMSGASPFASSFGYLEGPDYSRAGFFGPCTPSIDDELGRHITGSISGRSMGTVIFWGDSTLFSNFSIFQPSSMRVLCLIESNVFLVLVAWLPIALFACAIYSHRLALLALPVALVIGACMLQNRPEELLRRFSTVAWAGDQNLVDDRYDPKASFSTVFAVSSASGILPRWTDSPEDEKGGIWVGETPPPNAGWRWLSPFLGASHQKSDANNPWDALVHLVNPEAVYTTSPPKANQLDAIDAGGFWTNEGVGSWWFGPGASPARVSKITCFLQWLAGRDHEWAEPSVLKPIGDVVPATLLMENGSRKQVRLPKFDAKAGDFVYLGAGVSAVVAQVDGQLVLSGSRDKDCFGYANTAKQHNWILFYNDDLPKRTSK